MPHISCNSMLDCTHVLFVLQTIVHGNFSIPSEPFRLESQGNSWYQAKAVQEFLFPKKRGDMEDTIILSKANKDSLLMMLFFHTLSAS